MTKDKKNPFRAYNLRKLIQALSLVGFLILLIYLDPLTTQGQPANFFLRLSPLAGLGASLASEEWIGEYWPALLLLLATVFMGRFFCGWVCPFGTTLDLTDKLLKGWKVGAYGNTPLHVIYDGKRLKFYLLAFLLLSLFISRQMVGWVDPLSLATNSYTVLAHPYLVALMGGFLDFLQGLPGMGALAGEAQGLSHKLLFAPKEPFYRNHFLFLIVFLSIAFLGLAYRRYWCRNLCPLGAILSLASTGSYFQRRVLEGCTVCGICQSGCRMGAITQNGKATQAGECILCMDCQEVCPSNAIRFTGKGLPLMEEIDLSRRGLVTACLLSVSSVPMWKYNFPWRSGKGGHRLIRPPGALPEEKFLAKCVRCGECLRVCKTNGLHPTVLEAGLEGAWTPRLIPRIGHCDYTCTLCSKVCPSGAISPQELPKKQSLAIGKAYIDHSRCIPWVAHARLPELQENWKDHNCAVCEEVCPIPTKAIHFNVYRDEQGRELRRPFVREEMCTGCGFCEYACPVVGRSAILVEGIQPQVAVVPVANEEGYGGYRIKYLFSQKVGDWVIKGQAEVFSGEKGLYEYIDGGAEPYLSYSFQQVATATYADTTGREILAEVWEFDDEDDAFGAYCLNRVGTEYQLGDEAFLQDNNLWVWKGKYYLSVVPNVHTVRFDDVIRIAEALLDNIPGDVCAPPAMLKYLPTEGLIYSSIRFFHQKIILDNVYISERPIEENVFGLDEETDAVLGEYVIEKGAATKKLLLIKYPDTELAKESRRGYIKLRQSWGEPSEMLDGILCFKGEEGYSGIYCRGSYLIVTFMSPDELWAEHYIRDVLSVLPLE
jgi:polyferredoxin